MALKQIAADATLENLLQEIAEGSTEALEALYRLTDRAVYAYALSILRNSYDAEDVLQECFIRVFRSAAFYYCDGKPMAWILTIAKNLCKDLLRKNQSVAELSDEAWLRLAAPDTVNDDRLILNACMKELSEKERQIVVLHAVAGFKHREIAQFLELSLTSVLSKYHRAIQKMKRRVQEQ